jgi:hypothetical protein
MDIDVTGAPGADREGRFRRPEARLTALATFWSARIADLPDHVHHYR